ncbi:hypothetical protein [Enterovirga sp. CN4-39]|uniref:hypothetical protein n=1 Tax=Enterovirga sp. CN4-39 TaxID=3400910 RepID=UPI003C072DF7
MNDAIQKALREGGSVNVRPLAKAAGVCPATLYRAISRGEIEAIQIGKRITIPAHIARKLLKLPEVAGASRSEAA